MTNKIKKTKEILEKQLFVIKPTKKEQEDIKDKTKDFIRKLEKNIKKKKIEADVFVGGSLAKGTLIKKDKYDIDIFVRFDKKYQDNELSKILEKVISEKKAKRIHGSRDYFQIKKGKIIFEIVPSVKISMPEKARNVTDLSYFHVNYVKKQINKNKKLADDIMLAKSFTYSCGCYGAESYIQGFSGYALELLVIYYKGFLNFIKKTAEMKFPLVLDPAKHYKNREETLLEINESKLQSPIVFVDPTFKQRNVLAALSEETFNKFKISCRDFLKNPSSRFFEKQEINEKNFNLIIEAKTNRQKGDIAGSKLRKFHGFISKELEKYFDIKKQEFSYDEKRNTARLYFSLKKKPKLITQGPYATDINNLIRFKKKHPKAIIKKGKAWSIEKNKITFQRFIKEFKIKNKKIIKEMGISGIKLIRN